MNKRWRNGAVVFAVLAALVVVLLAAGGNKPVSADEPKVGSDTIYTDGTTLTQVNEIGEIASPNGKVSVKIYTDAATGRYFYSTYMNGKAVIYASQLGINTEAGDLTSGVSLVAGSVSGETVTDEYVLENGKHTDISDTCNETSFDLADDAGNTLTVVMRVYDDGIAYRYVVNNTSGGTAKISAEASEFVLPDDSYIISYTPNVTYEGTFVKSDMNTVYNVAKQYTTPTLACIGENECWMLLTEAAVFSEEESYCSSVLQTTSSSKNLKWDFGNKQAGMVSMEYPFKTPWRVAVIAEDLNTLVNTDIVTSVNPAAEDTDWSWVQPGKLAWSWWSSTGDNPIAFDVQYDYIDFAAANGWEYVCLDYGWCLWEDYSAKVEELVDYAADKGVGIWLWYGVNNVGHTAAGAYPKYSLLNQETIEREFTWAESIGIKGVKVDYYESDSQATMKQMYLCADIAANHKLMVLFHGCTNPGGENRTYPNILSYEAVYGAEYYKWRNEPSTKNIITYIFTRNVIGSADFTPTAMPVNNITATHGFMMGTVVAIESGLVHYAENVHVYEGYNGLSFLNDVPVTWDETIIAEGDPQSYATVARRSGADWYLGSLTTQARTTAIALDFLEDGKTYTAYIYKDNESKSGLEIVTQAVTSEDVLAIDLVLNGGFAARITESEFDTTTDYEKKYTYIEAEDATRAGSAVVERNQYASGMDVVGYIGGGDGNTVTFDVEAAEAGVYEVKVFYVSGADRRFEVTVNDAAPIRTGQLNSGDWVSVDQLSLYLELKEGTNTISFGNASVYAPSVDRIAVAKSVSDEEATVSDETEDEVETNVATTFTYDMYEAEQATVTGATKEGACVGWLGSAPKATNNVTFSQISVETDGTYYLLIRTMAAEDRDVYVSINGEAGIKVPCLSSGSWDAYSMDTYIEVELRAGTNTIMIYNEVGYCPNLDSIGISTETISGEGTPAETTPTQTTANDDTQNGEKTQGNNTILYVVIAVVAIAVIGGVAFAMRKKKAPAETPTEGSIEKSTEE